MGSQFILKYNHSTHNTLGTVFAVMAYTEYLVCHIAWSSLHLRNSVVPDTSNNGETDLDNGIRNKK